MESNLFRTEVANLKAQITDAKDESTKRAEAEILQLTADIYSLKVIVAWLHNCQNSLSPFHSLQVRIFHSEGGNDSRGRGN